MRGTVVAVGLLLHGTPNQAPAGPEWAADISHEIAAEWLRNLPGHTVSVDQMLAQMLR
jgi:hypothetical protein